jgi:crossover junction endodeoxyribonuclease RuvC
MILLGLDPGIGRTGFGVLDTNQPRLFVQCGCLTTLPGPMADRLHVLGQDIAELIRRTKPDRAIVESVFFATNKKTAMLTAQARGVLLYILREHHIPVTSLTPLQIKSRLCGFGGADKQQVQAIVTKRLSLTAPPQPDDAADALAAALCLADMQETQSALHHPQAYDSLEP